MLKLQKLSLRLKKFKSKLGRLLKNYRENLIKVKKVLSTEKKKEINTGNRQKKIKSNKHLRVRFSK